MLGSFGATELIIILVIVMVLFGAKRLPELAKGLGQGISLKKHPKKNLPTRMRRPLVHQRKTIPKPFKCYGDRCSLPNLVAE